MRLDRVRLFRRSVDRLVLAVFNRVGVCVNIFSPRSVDRCGCVRVDVRQVEIIYDSDQFYASFPATGLQIPVTHWDKDLTRQLMLAAGHCSVPGCLRVVALACWPPVLLCSLTLML